MSENAISTIGNFISPENFNVANVAGMPLPESWDEAMAIVQDVTEISDATVELVDEWPEVEKAELVNKPFFLAYWTISTDETDELEFGNQYIVARGITKDGQRFRFSDGSTGIFRQLKQITNKRFQNEKTAPFANVGLLCPNGLIRSDYRKVVNGKASNATTFYIAS